MKIFIAISVSEAITLRQLIQAQLPYVARVYEEDLKRVSRKVADALTRQAKPRSLVSHED